MANRVVSTKVSPFRVGLDAGVVDSVTAVYGGDALTAYAQIHDIAPVSVVTFLGVPSAAETVTLGSVVYTFVAALTEDPGPPVTGQVPGEVVLGATVAATLANLVAAARGASGEGTTYATDTEASDVEVSIRSNGISLRVVGVAGDAVASDAALATVSVATLDDLAASDVPVAYTAIRRGKPVTFGEGVEVENGCVVAISSTAATYTAISGLTEVEFDVSFTPSVETVDANLVCDYKFDGALTDELGGRALASSGGTLVYSVSPNGGRCYQTNTNYLAHAEHEVALKITTALTVSALVRFSAIPNKVFLSFSNTGGIEADNSLFSIAYDTAGTLTWTQMNGAATASSDTAAPIIGINEWVHITYTRPTAGTSVKLYLNGYLADTSGALTLPTGGTVSELVVGADVARTGVSAVKVARLQIWNTELTAAQVLASVEEERTL
jgi:Concanavalin A-like lectin/glucanases superfamily